MACHNVMSVLINHRSKKATDVQDILTKYGCIIKMRLGLHETGDACSEDGLIILKLEDDKSQIQELIKDLNSIEGVKAKNIELCAD
jgi:metal-responsive CopG/Arc/MetJ family transcriptional regulator